MESQQCNKTAASIQFHLWPRSFLHTSSDWLHTWPSDINKQRLACPQLNKRLKLQKRARQSGKATSVKIDVPWLYLVTPGGTPANNISLKIRLDRSSWHVVTGSSIWCMNAVLKRHEANHADCSVWNLMKFRFPSSTPNSWFLAFLLPFSPLSRIPHGFRQVPRIPWTR